MQQDRLRNGKWKCEGKDEQQRIKREKKIITCTTHTYIIYIKN